MANAAIFNDGKFQAIDNSGKVVPYGKVYFIDAATGSPVITYSDAKMTIANPHPVELSASGKADIFLGDATYDITLKDKNGATVWTINNFIPATGGGILTPAVVVPTKEEFTNKAGSAIVLANTPVTTADVYKNGKILNTDEYSLDGNIIVFITPLIVSDEIVVEYTKILDSEYNHAIITYPYDTLSDLKASTTAYRKVWVSGYYTKGDGAFGSHVFEWDATSVEADNGGTIIALTSVATGRYKLKYDGVVNIKWFGAVGDGITDDAVAIQNAIDYAVNKKGDVIIPTCSDSYLCQSTISIKGISAQGIKIIGGSTYDIGSSIKTNASIGILIDSDNFTQLEGIHLRGTNEDNNFITSQSLIKITSNGNLIANNSWLSGAGILVDRADITDSYYTTFYGCRFDTCNIIYKSSVTYNLHFINCRAVKFDFYVESSAGPGPINFTGGSIEEFTTGIASNVQSNMGLPVNCSGVYIENYPQAIAGGSFAKSNFTADYCFYGMSSLSISGCMVYLEGIRRFLYPGVGISTTVSSSGNTFCYNIDASSLLSDTEFVYPTNAIGIFNDSNSGPGITKVTANSDPSMQYNISYYGGTDGYGYDIIKNKLLYRKPHFENVTLLNGYALVQSEEVPCYSIEGNILKIRGTVDATNATDTPVFQIPNINITEIYRRNIGFTYEEEVVSIRLLSDGTLRIENYASLNNKTIHFGTMDFLLD